MTSLFEQADWPRVAVAVATAMIVAFAVSEVIARLARALILGVLRLEHQQVSATSPIVVRPLRIIRGTVFIVAFAALILPALDLVGVQTTLHSDAALGRWLVGSGLRIAIIGILAYLLVRIIAVATQRLEEDLTQVSAPDLAEQSKRARTLSGLIRKGLTSIVIIIAGLMVLHELNIDIMPLLTGAGIAGLAVGFGAQTLVKDLIAGFFMTFENHIRVGDVARVNGVSGLVEEINLRTIVLRDFEGVVHVFPNGSVTTLANMTKDFSYFVLDVGIAYDENLDRVTALLRKVGDELAADPRFSHDILEPLEIQGIEAFADSQIKVRVRVKTVPQKQWDTGRELRQRIKRAFDAAGIQMPFPHMSIDMSKTP